MKKRMTWFVLPCLIVVSLVLTSCATSTTTSTTLSTTTLTQTPITTSATTSSTVQSSTTNTTTAAVSTTVTSTGNWWDTLGTPVYGGTINIRTAADPNDWDPYQGTTGTVLPNPGPGYQSLFQPSYTVDPKIWDLNYMGWVTPQYEAGLLASSYEMPNPYTLVVQLRQDVYWWNIAPVNGRQFVAADVVFHYDRALGLGDGFTTGSAWYSSNSKWATFISVVATGQFTVTFNWKSGTSPLSILYTLMSANNDLSYECPEAVAAWGNLNDWHHTIGTGPFLLTDFVDGSSCTQTKNPNYYEYDARFPQNKLPYVNTRVTLIIPNNATAEAAMRVGKIDAYPTMPVQDALNMEKTNPSIVVKNAYPRWELTLDPNIQVAPYINLNVRIAMQHAIDIPTIAQTYYQGYAVPEPAGDTSNQLTVYPYYPYPDWTQAQKDEYAYNPTLAKQMLAAAGFPNGFNTDCILESDADQSLYQIVQSELAAVGINMSIQLMSPADWSSYVITNRKFDALAARNTGTLGQSINDFSLLQLDVWGFTFDYIGINDPQIMGWYNDAMAAQSIDQVNQDVSAFCHYVVTQHFATSLGEPETFNMVQRWVGGNPGAGPQGQNNSACWITPSLKAQ